MFIVNRKTFEKEVSLDQCPAIVGGSYNYNYSVNPNHDRDKKLKNLDASMSVISLSNSPKTDTDSNAKASSDEKEANKIQESGLDSKQTSDVDDDVANSETKATGNKKGKNSKKNDTNKVKEVEIDMRMLNALIAYNGRMNSARFDKKMKKWIEINVDKEDQANFSMKNIDNVINSAVKDKNEDESSDANTAIVQDGAKKKHTESVNEQTA